MTALQLANVLMAVAAAALWSFVFFYILPHYRLDCYRQEMFELRDELFDFAASGKIAFSDPAYTLLRRQMNALIRYGHQLTLYRVLMSVITRKVIALERPDFDWQAEWCAGLEGIESADVRYAMGEFHERATIKAVRRLVSGSVPLMLGVFGFGMFELANRGLRSYRDLGRAAYKKVLVGPFDPQRIEQDALCAQ